MEPQPDWMRVVAQQCCDQCGLAASTVDRGELAGALSSEAAAWTALLGGAAEGDLRRRHRPDVWSALEYGAHTRDVLAVFTERIGRTLTESRPAFGWWDHDAAVVAERYNEQRPGDVASALAANADRLGTTLSAVDTPGWARTGTRRDGEVFTVVAFARFALHEVRHHRFDAEASLLA